jgi:hypothetical protein
MIKSFRLLQKSVSDYLVSDAWKPLPLMLEGFVFSLQGMQCVQHRLTGRVVWSIAPQLYLHFLGISRIPLFPLRVSIFSGISFTLSPFAFHSTSTVAC